MQINKITPNVAPSFRKGLTYSEIQKVYNMDMFEYETITKRLFDKYGIVADVKKSNCIAFCLEKTVEIMKRAGFKLPQFFDAKFFDNTSLACYEIKTDKVFLNLAYYEAFDNLELLNKLEEFQNDYHPETQHFLSTYLHEFTHAAHMKNINQNSTSQQDFDNKFEFLISNSPNKVLLSPLRSYLLKFQPEFFENFINKHFPTYENGRYAKTNLIEFMAESNTRKISELLGEYFNINNVPQNWVSKYVKHPSDWSVDGIKSLLTSAKNQKKASYFLDFVLPGAGMAIRAGMKSIGAEKAKQDIEYSIGDIWHGDVNRYKEKSILWNDKEILNI